MKKVFLAVVLVLVMAVGVWAGTCPMPGPLGCEGATINMNGNTVIGDDIYFQDTLGLSSDYGEVRLFDLVKNGNFFQGASYWTTSGTGWTFTHSGENYTVLTKTAAASGSVSQQLNIQAGEIYIVKYTLNRTAGSITVSLGGATGTARSAAGAYTDVLTAVSTAPLTFTPDATFAGNIDKVWVYKKGAGVLRVVGDPVDNTADGFGVIEAYGIHSDAGTVHDGTTSAVIYSELSILTTATTSPSMAIYNNLYSQTRFAPTSGTASMTSGIGNEVSSTVFDSAGTAHTIPGITGISISLSEGNKSTATYNFTTMSGLRIADAGVPRDSGTFTGTDVYGIYLDDFADFTKGTKTRQTGIYIANQAIGTTNYGTVLADGADCHWLDGITGTGICSETVTLSSANILAANTPITVVAKRAGAILEFVGATIVYNDATDYTGCDAAWVFEYETSGTDISATFAAHTIFTANADAILIVQPATLSASLLANVNKDIMVINPGTQCATGTGTADIKITYRVQVTGL